MSGVAVLFSSVTHSPSSSQFPTMFSYCSQVDLETFVEGSHAACLRNAPDPDRLVGGPVCGNGFLERGEQCDCGNPQVQPVPTSWAPGPQVEVIPCPPGPRVHAHRGPFLLGPGLGQEEPDASWEGLGQGQGASAPLA